jgi:uncharacterized protein YegJ (DUF2314 family)
MLRSCLAFFLVGLLSACTNPAALETPTEPKENIKYVSTNDAVMSRAIATAKKTSNNFIQAFRHPKPSFHGFSVKKPYLIKGQRFENMWIGDLHEVGDRLEGRITNTPVEATEVREGQLVSVKLNEVIDWMYIDGNSLVGGYTIKLFYERMNKEEKKSFLNQAGFIIK